jgi:serine/threonine protein kinase
MEDLAPGARIGDYRIERELGRGGMSVVYAATHLVIGKRAAIKVVRPVLCADATGMLRAIQEARAINQIRHPNIVDVYGYGRLADGRCYLIMERLEGETLFERMGWRPISHEEALAILVSLCEALAAAHKSGIVHRDVKPANIFLTDDNRVKLLDFGLAKLLADERGITQHGAVLGTPDYIAPEQAKGGVVDARADVYSLGVVAFEMFAGQLPFCDDNPAVLIARHIQDEPPRLRELRADIPALADDTVAAMLQKDPAARPSILAVREALLGLRPPIQPRRRQSKRWAASAALLLMLGVGAGGFGSRVQRGRAHPEPRKPPVTAPVVVTEVKTAAAEVVATPPEPPPPAIVKHRKKRAPRPPDDGLIDPFADDR